MKELANITNTYEIQESHEVNIDMPLKFLTNHKLELVSKNFADDPTQETNYNQRFEYSAGYIENSDFLQASFSNISTNQATKYEEFDVAKINDYGNKQERVLGINFESIYNKPPRDSGFNLLKFFKGPGTKNPVREMRYVTYIKILSEDTFVIEYKEPESKVRYLKYVAKPNEIYYIVNKMKYLLYFYHVNSEK